MFTPDHSREMLAIRNREMAQPTNAHWKLTTPRDGRSRWGIQFPDEREPFDCLALSLGVAYPALIDERFVQGAAVMLAAHTNTKVPGRTDFYRAVEWQFADSAVDLGRYVDALLKTLHLGDGEFEHPSVCALLEPWERWQEFAAECQQYDPRFFRQEDADPENCLVVIRARSRKPVLELGDLDYENEAPRARLALAYAVCELDGVYAYNLPQEDTRDDDRESDGTGY